MVMMFFVSAVVQSERNIDGSHSRHNRLFLVPKHDSDGHSSSANDLNGSGN